MVARRTRRSWLVLILASIFCGIVANVTVMTLADGPEMEPGGGGGGNPNDPVPPPGSDPCAFTLCWCPQHLVTPEDRYFCGDPCAALKEVGYDCGALDLEEWVFAHCPGWEDNGCPVNCLLENCKLTARLCECQDPDFQTDRVGGAMASTAPTLMISATDWARMNV